ncbi:MAG: hypothetical protein ILA34_04760 [Bacteroidaceae bacterium]|nr:hypothetical protein [Bacteroidaceae bacterium]
MKLFPKIQFFLIALAVALLQSCGQKAAQTAPAGDTVNDTIVTIPVTETDSTIYGKAGQSGMSTFALHTDDGDTLLLSRTTDDGEYGRIIGGLHIGDRFAVLTTDSGQSLKTAINLSQVELFVKNYKILNGRLILLGHDTERGDTVDILSLNADSMKIEHAASTRTLQPLAIKAGN